MGNVKVEAKHYEQALRRQIRYCNEMSKKPDVFGIWYARLKAHKLIRKVARELARAEQEKQE